jgi:hypothetical protein
MIVVHMVFVLMRACNIMDSSAMTVIIMLIGILVAGFDQLLSNNNPGTFDDKYHLSFE